MSGRASSDEAVKSLLWERAPPPPPTEVPLVSGRDPQISASLVLSSKSEDSASRISLPRACACDSRVGKTSRRDGEM